MEESACFVYYVKISHNTPKHYLAIFSSSFLTLRQKRIPYEVLPSINYIVNLLAASGFPADRFAIEYFPYDAAAALEKRKSMKMSVAVVNHKHDLLRMIETIKRVYGAEQMIYAEDEGGKMIFRGKIGEILGEKVREVRGKTVRLAISPFISTFNSELKEQRSKAEKLYG